MKIIEVKEIGKTNAEGLKSYMVLSYGCYEDKKTDIVYVAGLRTAQRVKAKSERDILAKLALKNDLSLISSMVDFPPDSHGMRQHGELVKVTGDFKPLLLEVTPLRGIE